MMKSATILALLAALPFLAIGVSAEEVSSIFSPVSRRDNSKDQQMRQPRQAVRTGRVSKGLQRAAGAGGDSAVYQRDLKSSKYGKGGGEGGIGDGECLEAIVYYNKADFKDAFEEIGERAGGANPEIEVFRNGVKKPVALYTEVSIAWGQKDCVVDGVWTFNTNPKGKPNAQVFTRSTCFATSSAIVGGTGPYACAVGTVKQENRGSRKNQFLKIEMCFSC